MKNSPGKYPQTYQGTCGFSQIGHTPKPSGQGLGPPALDSSAFQQAVGPDHLQKFLPVSAILLSCDAVIVKALKYLTSTTNIKQYRRVDRLQSIA